MSISPLGRAIIIAFVVIAAVLIFTNENSAFVTFIYGFIFGFIFGAVVGRYDAKNEFISQRSRKRQ